jgi:hypothetical protein
MSMTQGDGGGGGGGSGEICTIKTSDLIGLQNNILSRLYKIEQFLTLLTGMDVTANSLSDITDNLGTVTNATLINALRGWITEGTFSGVAISTLGWQLYSECAGGMVNYPIVVMDEDGVMQFGAEENGQLCGSAVQDWNEAATTAASLKEQDYASYTNTAGVHQRGATVTSHSIDSTYADCTITISTAGLYIINSFAYWTGTSGVAGDYASASISFYVANLDQAGDEANMTGGVTTGEPPSIVYVSFTLGGALNHVMYCNAGDRIRALATKLVGTGGMTGSYTGFGLSVARISG